MVEPAPGVIMGKHVCVALSHDCGADEFYDHNSGTCVSICDSGHINTMRECVTDCTKGNVNPSGSPLMAVSSDYYEVKLP